MFKAFEKLRRAPHHTREKFTALISVVIVGLITLVWFVLFLFSVLSTDFYKAPTSSTAPEVSQVNLQVPFSE